MNDLRLASSDSFCYILQSSWEHRLGVDKWDIEYLTALHMAADQGEFSTAHRLRLVSEHAKRYNVYEYCMSNMT